MVIYRNNMKMWIFLLILSLLSYLEIVHFALHLSHWEIDPQNTSDFPEISGT